MKTTLTIVAAIVVALVLGFIGYQIFFPSGLDDASVADPQTPNPCGNGVVDALEQCDDNNQIDGDGCDSSCQIEPITCTTESNAYIDFENIPGIDNAPRYPITNQYEASHGIVFESGPRISANGANGGACPWSTPLLAATGPSSLANQLGIYESANSGATNKPLAQYAEYQGNWLISPGSSKGHACQLIINFTRPSYGLSFDVWDVDNTEGWVVKAYDFDGNEIAGVTDTVQTAASRSTWYNGVPYTLTLESPNTPMFQVLVQPTRPKRNNIGFGLAFDRFSPFCVDPVDAPDPSICGDGTIDTENGEECDNGDQNADTSAQCNTSCQLNPICNNGLDDDGDGFTDCTAGAEDPGCFPDGRGGGTCNPNDTSEEDAPASCGDGNIDGAEQCDDGNFIDVGDLCGNDCTLNPECSDGLDNDGDGFIDCTIGAEDPGCFPDGMGGGGACNPGDDNEVDLVAAPVGVIPSTAFGDDSSHFLIFGFLMLTTGVLIYRMGVMEKIIIWKPTTPKNINEFEAFSIKDSEGKTRK